MGCDCKGGGRYEGKARLAPTKWIIAGAVVIVLVVIGLVVFSVWQKDKVIIDAGEVQNELQVLQDEYNDADYTDFLGDDSIRRAADDAADEFRRKRDEALQRIRGRYADNGINGSGGGSD